MSEPNVPVAPLVEDVLNAAHEVAAAGLEMDSRVEDELHAALLHLVRAVYAHEDALDLQRELEVDGVRESSVVEVTADGLPIGTYAAHVDQVIGAAEGVAETAAAPNASPVPPYALAPMCTLVEAVTAYSAHTTSAKQWQRAGNRLELVTADGPDDTLPPPRTSPPAGAGRSADAGSTTLVADPTPGGDAAALRQDQWQLDAAPAIRGAETQAAFAASRGPCLGRR